MKVISLRIWTEICLISVSPPAVYTVRWYISWWKLNSLTGLKCSLSNATAIADCCRPWFCKAPVLYREPPGSPGIEQETWCSWAAAAQGVSDSFWRETITICTAVDSITVFHYTRNSESEVSVINFIACHYINAQVWSTWYKSLFPLEFTGK